jgi:hypothetical protein
MCTNWQLSFLHSPAAGACATGFSAISHLSFRHRRIYFELEAAMRIPSDTHTKRNDKGNPWRGQEKTVG